MAIGLITNPTTPIAIGTVASNTWASSVEDNINGLISGTGPTLKALQIDGTGGASSTAKGIVVTGANGQLRLTQTSAPGIVLGTGAGTSPTSIGSAGSDAAGYLFVNTGTTPAGSNATIATMTFSAAYTGSGVSVILEPGNALTATLSGSTQVSVSSTNSSWSLVSGSSALTAGQTYIWHYHVIAF